MQYDVSDVLEYIVMLIGDFAKRFSITPKMAYRYIRQYGGIKLIEENYGIMHTLSFSDAVEGLASYCSRNGGELR